MQYFLENDYLKVTVDSLGCEIRSVYNKKCNCEQMWDANPSGWKRTAPILFPIIGKYKDNKSVCDGKVYEMSQHGFARDLEFELVENTDSKLVMRLIDNENTKIKYPFNFRLELEYELLDNKITEIMKVHNTNDCEMYFSIGAHPAFITPNKDESMAGCEIEFDTDSISYGLLSSDGLLERKQYDMPLKDRKIAITKDMFDKDALIIENAQAKCVSLIKDGKKFVTVEFDAPVFGLWSCANKNVPFVCIEPWYGRTDAVDFNGELKDREWSNKLGVGETFEKSFTITYGC